MRCGIFMLTAVLSLDIIEGKKGEDYTKLSEIRLGPNIDNKETFQAVIKAGLNPSSDVRQMSRQIAVIWNCNWNGIVQGCYIRYSRYDSN